MVLDGRTQRSFERLHADLLANYGSRTLYEGLGVRPTATIDQIKEKFREKSRKYHPDVNPEDPNAEQRFKAVNDIYQVLGKPAIRTLYDAWLQSVARAQPSPFWAPPQTYTPTATATATPPPTPTPTESENEIKYVRIHGIIIPKRREDNPIPQDDELNLEDIIAGVVEQLRRRFPGSS